MNDIQFFTVFALGVIVGVIGTIEVLHISKGNNMPTTPMKCCDKCRKYTGIGHDDGEGYICLNMFCPCHSTPHIQDWEKPVSLKEEFIRKYCNDHGTQIRWLRGAFIYEKEKLYTILGYLERADALLSQTATRTRKEVIEEILGGIRISWDISEKEGEWCVQFWKFDKDGTHTLLTQLNNESNDGGAFNLLSLLNTLGKKI